MGVFLGSAPSPLLAATATNTSGANAFISGPPSPTLKVYGGATIALQAPAGVLGFTATSAAIAVARLNAPAALVTASGLTGGVASADLGPSMGTLSAFGGGSARLSAPAALVSATATQGGVASAQIIAPRSLLTASITRGGTASAVLTAPAATLGASAYMALTAPRWVLEASGSSTQAVAYEAYAVNIKHRTRMQGEAPSIDETTRYTSFPFDQIVRLGQQYLGVGPDGVYLLGGDTDNGTEIEFAVRTHIDDFDAQEKKTLAAAYFGGRIGSGSTVTLYVGESGERVHAYNTPREAVARNHRQKFGHGIKDRYFALGITGAAEFALDDIRAEIIKHTRRI